MEGQPKTTLECDGAVGDRDVEPTRDARALGRQAWLGLRYSGVGL